MATDTELQTKSYGHVLARQLRIVIEALPQADRQRILQELRTRVLAHEFAGKPLDTKTFKYIEALLQGKKPSVSLGHNHKSAQPPAVEDLPC